jgi:ATP-dependent DNA ligase
MIESVLLFKRGSKNKILRYHAYIKQHEGVEAILFEGYVFVRESNGLGEKIKVETKAISKGKSNRTPLEQCMLELNSAVEKKKSEGYKTFEELGIITNLSSDIPHYDYKNKSFFKARDVLEAALSSVITDKEGRIKPMLLHKAALSTMSKEESKGRKKIKYPCLVQPKLDGVCALGNRDGLWSRGGKSGSTANGISWNELCPDIVKELKVLCDNYPDRVFHGELYLHGETLDTIGEALKDKKPLTDKIEFHIFDVIPLYNLDQSYIDRVESYKDEYGDFLLDDNYTKLKFVIPTYSVYNEKDLLRFEDKCLEEGYEGVVVRDCEGLYEIGKRSSKVLKLVRFDETEVKIVDVIPMENKPEQGLFVCEYDGKTFNVTPAMSHNEREFLLSNKFTYIGKLLTIKHRGYTKYNTPRIAVGKTIRDYE